MARFVDAIDVPTSPVATFAYLADFSNCEEWDPGVVQAGRAGHGPIEVGSEFDVTVSFLGQRSELRYEIEAFDAPHRIVLVGGNDTIRSIDEITVSPRGDGSRITYEARLELPGILALADPLLQLAFDRIGKSAAEGLRKALEQRHANPASARDAA